jgi:arsenate reductase
MLTLYTYKSCATCRQAVKWLAAQGIAFTEKPIRETPPSVAELRALLAHLDGERRRLCNTSGKDYRDQKFGDQLDALSAPDFLARLAANGNLVKRPFLHRPASASAPALGLAGFNATAWGAALLRR